MATGIAVREVTDAECASYADNGWVKLPGLLSEEDAAELLRLGEEMVGPQMQVRLVDPSLKDPGPRAHQMTEMITYNIPEEDDRFMSLALSPQMGRVAARLMSDPLFGPRQARYFGGSAGTLLVKTPENTGASSATRWHQDAPYYPFDRSGALIIWVALVPMTAEMGTMRFMNGSHRLGSFGQFQHVAGADALERYPGIANFCEVSAPFALRPGDATVHNIATLHSASSNLTDKPRWALTLGYFPSETFYTGQPQRYVDSCNLQPYQPFDHPRFPIVG